ncbi:hypothetical protein KIF24_20155 [Micromonospora sp. Llam7]|uniref:hypothetical protein n=1 Tax=Micromonospora tarapacensis TaxID=2835305 RepID=UPI001C838D5A|nr:hypothetical protein [Micromonospora tarapacensis]MBX7268121.1 hypothetical protein [Micromonospora tarapacensis]
MADEIRQALARLAEPVVPRPDPYQRLLRRVRRRRRRRMAAASVIGLAMAAATLPSLGAADRQPTTGETTHPAYQPASLVEEPMVLRLLDSPTRGNLAADTALIAAIERGYRAARTQLLVDPALDEVRVLLAHDAPGARTVVVAFLGDSHALLRQGSGRAGASVPELLDRTGTPDEPLPLEPYLFSGRHSLVDGVHVADLAVGLAPAGCRVETSVDGRIQPDGSVRRTWQQLSTDGFVVRGAGETTERWQFTCDGVVRYAGPSAGGGVVRYAGPSAGGSGTIGPAQPISPGSTTDVPAALTASAVRELEGMLGGNGLTGATPQVVWTGRLPAWVPGAPTAALVSSCSTDGGCAGLLKAETVGRAGPESPHVAADHRIGTGTPDVIAVPVPGEVAGVLVAGPESAVRAELLDRSGKTVASGPLTGGVTAFRVDHRQVSRVRVFDTDDRLLHDVATPRLAADSGELAEPTVWAW